MKRALLAVAALLTLAASPTFAGYLIIRVLLEGGSGDEGDTTAPPGGPPGMLIPGKMGKPPGGASFPPPGKSSSMPPPGFGPPGMTPGAGGTATAATETDPTRSVVVVIPLEADLVKRPLDKTKPGNHDNNPSYQKFSFPFYSQKLQSALFVDSSTIQLYTELLDKPAPRKTRGTEMREKYLKWAQSKKDPRLLYDALILALESGMIRDRLDAQRGAPIMDAMTFAQELLEVAAEKKLPLPPEAERFVKAWGQMSPAVTQPAPQPSDAEDWKAQLDATAVSVDGHYAIVYWDSPAGEVARRGMQLNDHFAAFYLWHATRGIVHPVPTKPLVVVLARQGKDVTRLYSALDGLPMQSDAFYSAEHNLLVLSPERRDDVGQTFLRQTQQLFAKGLSRTRLLAGEIPKLDHTGEKGPRPEEVARANTLAAVEKLVMEESEIAAVTREGTRQLFCATGQLPQHVTLPNWLTEGAVNFYTRPRGPAFVEIGEEEQDYMTVAMTTGYGVPNYVLHRYFIDIAQPYQKQLNVDPRRIPKGQYHDAVKLLGYVLHDTYFAGIKDGDDPDPAPIRKKKKPAGQANQAGEPGVPPGLPFGPPGGQRPGIPGPMIPGGMLPGMLPGGATQASTDAEDPATLLRKKRDRLIIKSQATAWALYYYLANVKPNELKQYVAELNKLPRDLPIDGRTAYVTFARVFGLAADQQGNVDPERMKKFAKDWLDYMSTVPRTSFDIKLAVPEPKKDDKPMFPGPMGGFPFSGGKQGKPGGRPPGGGE